MKKIDCLPSPYKIKKIDYLARLNDHIFTKPKVSDLDLKYNYDWNDDRKIDYGVYKYIKEKWQFTSEQFNKVKEWICPIKKLGYKSDYSVIFFK